MHLLAAFACVSMSPFLLRRGRGDKGRVAGLAVFVLSCVLLLLFSGTYHLLGHGTEARGAFQRLDYAAIYSLIAGSFT